MSQTPEEQLTLAKRVLEGRDWFYYDELSGSAQERALNNHAQSLGQDWHECILQDLTDDLTHLGVYNPRIGYSGFSSQGNGAHFTGDYSYAVGSQGWFGKESELAILVKELNALQRRNFYQLTAEITHRGFYRHENCTHISVDRKDGACVTDEVADELAEALRSIMRHCYRALEKEYDYQTGEGAEEYLRSNEERYTEDGAYYEEF
jgi:hypothetical protein